MQASLFFDTEQLDTVLMVVPQGSIGSLSGRDIDIELRKITQHIEQSELKRVVIDFQKVAYFGSIMLATIHSLWKGIRAAGGDLVLCNISEVGLEVLHVSRLDTLWTIASSREEALKILE